MEYQGCGDNSCLIVKPNGMGTNGGCRCYKDSRTARRAIHFLLSKIHTQDSEIARLQKQNEQLQLKNKELESKYNEINEALLSLEITYAMRKKDKSILMSVNTSQQTHDLICIKQEVEKETAEVKETYDRSVKSE